ILLFLSDSPTFFLHRLYVGMKTKRKLVPKSIPIVGDRAIVFSTAANHVSNVDSNVSTKRQRLYGSNYISSVVARVGPSGIQSVVPVDANVLSYLGTSYSSLISRTVDANVLANTGTSQPGPTLEGCGTLSVVVIIEYLVKVNQQARILELNLRNMKITILTTNTPYPSRKIRAILRVKCLKLILVTTKPVPVSQAENLGMKTKRKLVPKSIPTAGDSTVGSSAAADRISNVNSNVSTKRQRLCSSNSVLSVAAVVGPPDVQSVIPVDVNEGCQTTSVVDLLDTHNALVQLFRTAREKFQDNHIPNFKVRLYNVIGARDYELPTGDMLGVIVYETGHDNDMDYDIVLEIRSGYPQRVNKLHASYMSLQFSLLFIYSQDGYSKDLKMVCSSESSLKDKRLTMLAYYSYYLHERANRYNYLSRTRKLFQQYVVTAFCAIEQNRIDFIREHQNDTRNDYLLGIYDVINHGDNDGSHYGSKLILPQSFTGGPCYMYSHYLDALAICHVYGNPSYIITFTCNVKWPEITDYMSQFLLLTTTDRADLVDRVFEMKIHEFVNYLRDTKPFGKVVADEYVRVRRDEDIDYYVSVELPLQDIDPEGYRDVSELMMHGPCGLANVSAGITTGAASTRPPQVVHQSEIKISCA
ncbi:DNA helicase, partial [Tanacetum coccineum]